MLGLRKMIFWFLGFWGFFRFGGVEVRDVYLGVAFVKDIVVLMLS